MENSRYIAPLSARSANRKPPLRKAFPFRGNVSLSVSLRSLCSLEECDWLIVQEWNVSERWHLGERGVSSAIV